MQCVSCETGCQQCNPANITECKTCNYDYVLKDGKCLANQNCSQGCSRCDPANVTACYRCRTGYAMTSKNKCVKCFENCRGSCAFNDIATCTACIPGYNLQDNQCKKCPDNFWSCPSDIQFNICEDGYKLWNDACVKICNLPCLTCSSSDSSKCLTCQPGFNLTSAGQCIFDETCNPYCEFCPNGYWQDPTTGTCNKCALNCQACNKTACIQCKDVSYLNNSGSCVACVSPCKTCISSTGCMTCIDGYLL